MCSVRPEEKTQVKHARYNKNGAAGVSSAEKDLSGIFQVLGPRVVRFTSGLPLELDSDDDLGSFFGLPFGLHCQFPCTVCWALLVAGRSDALTNYDER